MKNNTSHKNIGTDIKKSDYKKYAEAMAPRSPLLKNCACAFLVGGLICCIGQGFLDIYGSGLGMSERDASALCSISLVFVASMLTGVGVFDNIARFAGAGTLVPITGFSNAVASSAMDSRSEGLVLGVGAKIFTVAGPVLLYGTLSGTAFGVVYYVLGLF